MHVELGKVMVFVSDVERCADWYTTHFGLARRASTHQLGMWCELELGDGLTLALHQAFDEDGPTATPTGSPTNPHKLVFVVDDVRQAKRVLSDQGVTMFDVDAGEGSLRCDGLDCEQHRFQLVESY